LTKKILDIISISNIDAQKELISCLPEINDDECHRDLAGQLQ